MSLTGRTRDLGLLFTDFFARLIEAIVSSLISSGLQRLAKYLAPRIGAWWTRFGFMSFIIALPLCATIVKRIEGTNNSRPSPFARFCLRVLLLLIPFGIRGIGYLSKMKLDAQRHPYLRSDRSAYVQYVKEHPPDQPTIWLCLSGLFLGALRGSALSVVRTKPRVGPSPQ